MQHPAVAGGIAFFQVLIVSLLATKCFRYAEGVFNIPVCVRIGNIGIRIGDINAVAVGGIAINRRGPGIVAARQHQYHKSAQQPAQHSIGHGIPRMTAFPSVYIVISTRPHSPAGALPGDGIVANCNR